MTIGQAVRALRKRSGKTQQVFATELGMSIRALFSYERGKMPEPKQLLAFAQAAGKLGRGDLAEIFFKAASDELNIKWLWCSGSALFYWQFKPDSPAPWYELQALEALTHCVDSPGYMDLACTVISALALAVERRAELEADPELARRFAEESWARGYAAKIDGQVKWETIIPHSPENALQPINKEKKK